MNSEIQEIKDHFLSIPNYSPQFQNLKESGFLAKGTNSFGVFEYIDPNQNISYAVKTFIFNVNENMDYIYKYLNDLNQNKLELNCIIQYKGFYFDFSENQKSIKINVVFEKFSGDLTTMIQNISYNQTKKLIEDLIFSYCELIGSGYILQNQISLKEIKYIQINSDEIQIKFMKAQLLEKVPQNPPPFQQIYFIDNVKYDIFFLGALILQLLANFTKIQNNIELQTPQQFLDQYYKNLNNFNDLFEIIQKGLEKENIEIKEISQLLSLLKKMVNNDEKKIIYPIQLYIQWLNFSNQDELYPTHQKYLKNNGQQQSHVKPNIQEVELQNSVTISDEQLAENIGKEQQDIQDDSEQLQKVENEGFNYPYFSDELYKNKKYTYQSGAIYEGEWLNKKRHGQGTLITTKGSRFIGNWIEDKFTGKGIVHYFSGAVLEGSWLNGLAQGYGILKQLSGAVYEGNFENNKKNGFGIEKFQNGTIYYGLYKNDEKTFGHFQYSSGNCYTGPVIKTKLNGFGKFIWANGRIYHGNFVDNIMDGPGIYNYESKVYQGCFKNNQFNGFGILAMPNGIEYGGPWVANKLNGYGFYAKNGKAQLVQWNNSKIVKKLDQKQK